jgi:hypothetical protein
MYVTRTCVCVCTHTHTHTHTHSSFLTTTRLPLTEAQVGYEMLDKGDTLGVQFTYATTSGV